MVVLDICCDYDTAGVGYRKFCTFNKRSDYELFLASLGPCSIEYEGGNTYLYMSGNQFRVTFEEE